MEPCKTYCPSSLKADCHIVTANVKERVPAADVPGDTNVKSIIIIKLGSHLDSLKALPLSCAGPWFSWETRMLLLEMGLRSNKAVLTREGEKPTT